MHRSAKDVLESAIQDDGAIGVALADWARERCLAVAQTDHPLDVEQAVLGYCVVLRAKMAAVAMSGLASEIQDILVHLNDQIHLIRPLHAGGTMFVLFAVDKRQANLALARRQLARLVGELGQLGQLGQLDGRPGDSA